MNLPRVYSRPLKTAHRVPLLKYALLNRFVKPFFKKASHPRKPPPVRSTLRSTVPTLPGCVSQGRTRRQALRHVKEAIEAYIESLPEDGFA